MVIDTATSTLPIAVVRGVMVGGRPFSHPFAQLLVGDFLLGQSSTQAYAVEIVAGTKGVTLFRKSTADDVRKMLCRPTLL